MPHQISGQGAGVFPVKGRIGSLRGQNRGHSGNANRTYGPQANLQRPTNLQASRGQAEEAQPVTEPPKGNETRDVVLTHVLGDIPRWRVIVIK